MRPGCWAPRLCSSYCAGNQSSVAAREPGGRPDAGIPSRQACCVTALLACGPDGLHVQVTSAACRPGDGWELTTETGRGQKRRGQHSCLILADQMNVREGASNLFACCFAAMVLVLDLTSVLPTITLRCILLVLPTADPMCHLSL